MSFFERLFKPKKKQQEQKQGCFMGWRVPKKEKQKLEEGRDDQTLIRTMSTISKPVSQITSYLPVQIIKSKLLLVESRLLQKEESLLCSQDLVGVVGRTKIQESVLKGNWVRLQIGPLQQLNQLRSLRPNCLDRIVVYFGQFGCQFDLCDFVNSQQIYTFVIRDSNLLLTVSNEWEKQVLKLFGQRPLRQCFAKLLWQVAEIDNSYFVTICNQYTNQEMQARLLKLIIANGCGEQKEDMLPLLSYYITLNQFVELTTANSKEFLNKLIENINKRPVNKVTNELAAVQEPEPQQLMLAKSVSEQNQTPNKNETSNSDCEEEAQYYLQRLQSKPMIDETKELIQLLIEEDSDKYHEDTHEASPPFFRIQKVRSKSDDITYLLDANTPIKVQEDQLFDKY